MKKPDLLGVPITLENLEAATYMPKTLRQIDFSIDKSCEAKTRWFNYYDDALPLIQIHESSALPPNVMVATYKDGTKDIFLLKDGVLYELDTKQILRRLWDEGVFLPDIANEGTDKP